MPADVSTLRERAQSFWGQRWNGRAALRARWYLRHAELGTRVRLRGTPVVVARGRIVIGERVQLVSTVATLELVAEAGGTLEIGARSLVNFGCSIVALDRVTIGPRALIGPHCMIMDTAFHDVDPARRLEPPTAQPITIGENVWLGARVVVLPGVTIGDDSVIGIGSVVTHDIPPRSVAVGVPAKVVKTL
jgi:acetyltransferase-like isoleucine patch superfamily enzyme